MPEIQVAASIHEIGQARWDACFPRALEGFDYLAAVEAAALPGFSWRYVIVEDSGRALAAAPAFITDYSLDTTLAETGRRIASGLRRLSPRALMLKLGCLGSPVTEDVGLGFAPGVREEDRPQLLAALVDAFEAEAARAGCWLLGVKDAPQAQAPLWASVGRRNGYHPTPGMPGAELAIEFDDVEAYLRRLSPGTRRDMRRKLRAVERLRIEVRTDLTGFEDQAVALYRQTRARSGLQFEALTGAYFTGVLERMAGRSSCVLYFAGSDLIGFNLLLHDEQVLLDKFFCMESERGPANNLWFVSWFTNVRLCLDRGLKLYRAGQAGYADKLRLGSRLAGAQMYFRHRRPMVNRALGWAAPLLADDPVPVRGAA